MNYVIEGFGALVNEKGEEQPLKAGDFALVNPDEKHQYRNKGDQPFKMICGVHREFESSIEFTNLNMIVKQRDIAMSKIKTRREFIQKVATGTALAAGMGPSVFAYIRDYKSYPPSDRLNVAAVGVAGRGKENIRLIHETGSNIVALCDVDWGKRVSDVFGSYPGAAKYKDYRDMLDKQQDIDAVAVSTPDHTHAVISMAAMKLGYHVFCEKPLAYSVHEVRTMTDKARSVGVMTQLGNQGHSMEDVRRLVEWIADGAIGYVHEVVAWSDRPRPSKYMISGLRRPEETPPVPDDLDWDLWIGPAPYRPYHPLYHYGQWRGWVDFGCGAIGDMGCHILDPAFWALHLGAPSSVEASTTTIDPEINRESYPLASIIRWEFPARGSMPPVVMSWYDGGLIPKLPSGISSLEGLGTNGAMLIGEKGTIIYGMHGAQGLRILPEEAMKAYREPPKTIPRVSGHHSNWVEACKTGNPASANWDHGGPLSEMVLLGGIAVRLKDHRLEWDSDKLRFTNSQQATALIKREYREGWSL